MLKMKIAVFLVAIFIAADASAVSKFIQNKGIVDIGHNQESAEIIVPKELIERDPDVEIIPNKITYQKRIQSEKIDCGTDFIGTETCSIEQTICPIQEEFTDGYSTPHDSQKTLLKICQYETVREGDRCYLDEDKNGVKDFTYIIKTGGYVWSGKIIRGYEKIVETGNLSIAPDGYLEIRHYSPNACDDDRNYVEVKINDEIVVNKGCRDSKDTGYITVYKNSDNVVKDISYSYSSRHEGGYDEYDTSYFIAYLYGPSKIITRDGFDTEEIDGKTYYYTTLTCPENTIEQTDGSCLMSYIWYSYHCPSDLNEYSIGWTAINEGFDCGDISCVNSETPPVNNCVRNYYTCPIDGSVKCGKTLNLNNVCESGYVWNNNRCERIEKYCGDSIYNISLDICQDISNYEKKCLYPQEEYDPSIDKCVSSISGCVTGEYEAQRDICIEEFVASCLDDGYEYDRLSGVCKAPDLPLCQDQYLYSPSKNECIGEMTVCSIGEVYNETTKKCEKSPCGPLETFDSSGRCETDIKCDGIVTSDNRCIPSAVIQ